LGIILFWRLVLFKTIVWNWWYNWKNKL